MVSGSAGDWLSVQLTLLTVTRNILGSFFLYGAEEYHFRGQNLFTLGITLIWLSENLSR